jgi:hypothetical protein
VSLQIPSHLLWTLIDRYFTYQTKTPYMVWNVTLPMFFHEC